MHKWAKQIMECVKAKVEAIGLDNFEGQNLDDLKKNPHNKPAKDSLARFYEHGVLQRLGINWKPEK